MDTSSRWLSASAYVVSIILGNAFVFLFGIGTLVLMDAHNPNDVYFSLTFPLGALWIGITFSMRDFVQRDWGHKKCWIWMSAAALVTLLFNVDLAIASLVSFIASEAIDWLVFYLMRNKKLHHRLMISNLISCPVDSVLFVTIAFGVPWYADAVWGQALVKYLFGLLALLWIPFLRKMQKTC